METQTQWAKYKLTATRLGRTNVHRFEDAGDIDATYTAMFYVLNRANRSDLWAKGRIELVNLDTGETVQTMEAK